MSTLATTSAAPQSEALNASTKSNPICALVKRTASYLKTAEPYGQSAILLVLRLTYGWFLVQAGWGKFANYDTTTVFFANLALPSPALMVALVATIELGGGVLLAFGASARLAAACIAIVMVGAITTAHAAAAFAGFAAFTQQVPFPYLVVALIVVAFGAGRFSIDHLITRLRKSEDASCTTT